ncbi:MAG: heavy-metal-associated domain-containing protein [Clostridia bacterium]|nr:heavy-metal-associated domain-containing protein [Clostridia bacterium]
MKKEVFIEGMSCSHCQKRVEEALKKQRGIKEVEVDLREKKAKLELDRNIDDKDIKELIEDLGYEVKKIENK